MPTPIKMPRLGESVAEGTIGSWLKNVGDWVERDESLAEIITDKINAELPSPVAGRLYKNSRQSRRDGTSRRGYRTYRRECGCFSFSTSRTCTWP